MALLSSEKLSTLVLDHRDERLAAGAELVDLSWYSLQWPLRREQTTLKPSLYTHLFLAYMRMLQFSERFHGNNPTHSTSIAACFGDSEIEQSRVSSRPRTRHCMSVSRLPVFPPVYSVNHNMLYLLAWITVVCSSFTASCKFYFTRMRWASVQVSRVMHITSRFRGKSKHCGLAIGMPPRWYST